MKKKILVVDDENEFAWMVANRLRLSGYEAHAVSDGANALDTALREKPDLILMDLLMPVVDGYTVLSLLKSRQETRHIPVVIFSAKGQPDEPSRARERGASDYITKPFESMELITKIRAALDTRQG